jgi:membrane-associated phospholipid phosphatase
VRAPYWKTFLLFLLPAAVYAVGEKTEPRALSVYEVSPARDLTITGAAFLMGVVPYVLESTIVGRRCPCPPSDVNSFDRGVIGNRSQFGTVVSDVGVGIAFLAPVLVDWLDVGIGTVFIDDMMVYAQTLAINSALVTGVKYSVQRPIPRVYAGDLSESYLSFYSGHTSSAFSALSHGAMTYNYRHEAGVWPWAITGLVGGAVAAGRVAGGYHFYSDVIIGALAGTSVGVVNSLLHRTAGDTGTLAVMPEKGGLRVVYSAAL